MRTKLINNILDFLSKVTDEMYAETWTEGFKARLRIYSMSAILTLAFPSFRFMI